MTALLFRVALPPIRQAAWALRDAVTGSKKHNSLEWPIFASHCPCPYALRYGVDRGAPGGRIQNAQSEGVGFCQLQQVLEDNFRDFDFIVGQ